ncbi:MAG: UvrD-helicase domain-containing protein, partial [Oscillospiraceae bacterium]|nr:UvrD-helicase domain-containing protein [Oscillospiraceae bacterium]
MNENKSDTQLVQTVLNKFFAKLNPEQRRAVFQVNGPLLIVAGAGSGKTSVLINRTANILMFGDAYHSPPQLSAKGREILEKYLDERQITDRYTGESRDIVSADLVRAINMPNRPKPWEILVVTFTKKA